MIIKSVDASNNKTFERFNLNANEETELFSLCKHQYRYHGPSNFLKQKVLVPKVKEWFLNNHIYSYKKSVLPSSVYTWVH